MLACPSLRSSNQKSAWGELWGCSGSREGWLLVAAVVRTLKETPEHHCSCFSPQVAEVRLPVH